MSDQIWECPYCQVRKPLKSKYTKSGHLAKCSSWKTWKESTLTPEFLKEEYLVKRKSFPQIAEELGLNSHASVYNALKKHGIPSRSVSKSKTLPKAKARAEQTNLKRYGHRHNFCADHPSRKAWEQRLWEEEGLTNVFQREEVKEKIKDTYEERYGVRNLWELEWYRDKITQSMQFSSIHREVCDFFKSEGVPFTIEYPISRDEETGRKVFFDVHLTGTNKLIEVNGDYWHANPSLYLPDDVFYYPQGIHTSSEVWQRDQDKNECALTQGYALCIVWESDIKNSWETVANTLRDFANEDQVNQEDHES